MATETNDHSDHITRKAPGPLAERLAAFRAKHPTRKLEAGNASWEYFISGGGERHLTLLTGAARFGETWFPLIEELERDFRMIVPTYPPLTSMADLVAGVHAILRHEEVSRTHILGTSMGGWIGQCFVRQHPDIVSRLILSNTSGPESFKPIQYKSAIAAAKVLPTRTLKRINKRRLVKLSQSDGPERHFWRAYWDEKNRHHVTKEALVNQLYAIADYNDNCAFSPGDLKDWGGQILIIESDNDAAFPADKRDALKALYPEARVKTLHRAGHTPAYRDNPEYIGAVRDFLLEGD